MPWTTQQKLDAVSRAVAAAEAASPTIRAAGNLGRGIKAAGEWATPAEERGPTRADEVMQGREAQAQSDREFMKQAVANTRAAQASQHGYKDTAAQVQPQHTPESMAETDEQVAKYKARVAGREDTDREVAKYKARTAEKEFMAKPLPTAPEKATSKPAVKGRPKRPKKKGASGASYEGQ